MDLMYRMVLEIVDRNIHSVYCRELSRPTIRRKIYPSATIRSPPHCAVPNFATPSSKPGGYSSRVDLPSVGDILVTMSYKVTDLCQPLANNILSTVTDQSCEELRGGENLKNLLQTRLPPGDKKEIDGEFKKTLVLGYQKPKVGKNKKQNRKSKKPLTAKEKRALGLYRLPKRGLKYSSFVSLNSLWLGYMEELLDLESLEKGGWSPNLHEETRQLQLQMRVCRADLTGALLTVASASCSSHLGVRGIVLMETKNTLQIISPDNRLRLIPKAGSSFQFEMSGYSFTFPGACIDSKPAERITKKLKNKFPCDF